MVGDEGRILLEPAEETADGGEATSEGTVGFPDRGGLDGLEGPFPKRGLDSLNVGVGAANLVVRMHDECKRLDSGDSASATEGHCFSREILVPRLCARLPIFGRIVRSAKANDRVGLIALVTCCPAGDVAKNFLGVLCFVDEVIDIEIIDLRVEHLNHRLHHGLCPLPSRFDWKHIDLDADHSLDA